MDAFDLLIAGLPNFTKAYSLFLIVAGNVLGIIFGVVPGLTATMGMAIFLPMTFAMSDVNGMLFLVGIFVGACYAGSISAILVNIPGTPSAIATGFDGYLMAQKGEAGRNICRYRSKELVSTCRARRSRPRIPSRSTRDRTCSWTTILLHTARVSTGS